MAGMAQAMVKTMPVTSHSLLKSELRICSMGEYIFLPGTLHAFQSLENRCLCLPIKAPIYGYCVYLIIISILFHSSKSVPVWMTKIQGHPINRR